MFGALKRLSHAAGAALRGTNYTSVRTATKRASGGTAASKSTAGRRLGPKKGEGEFVKAGQIIWRQRGTAWYPGENAGIGRDHTLYAREPGYVRFYRDPFHPKRKFIGVALSPEWRLPTPHFEPRRRRLGLKVIDNDIVAEFEREYLSKKEEERQLARTPLVEQRIVARAARLASFQETLAALVPNLSEADQASQAARFLKIFQFMRGGRSFSDARAVVDAQALEDLAIEVKAQRITLEEQQLYSERASAANAATDAAVMMSPRLQLTKFQTTDEINVAREDAFKELVELTADVVPGDATPKDVRDKIMQVFARPLFSEAELKRMEKQYIKRALPVRMTPETRPEYVKKAGKGMGQMEKVWDAAAGRMAEYFVPKGAAKLYI